MTIQVGNRTLALADLERRALALGSWVRVAAELGCGYATLQAALAEADVSTERPGYKYPDIERMLEDTTVDRVAGMYLIAMATAVSIRRSLGITKRRDARTRVIPGWPYKVRTSGTVVRRDGKRALKPRERGCYQEVELSRVRDGTSERRRIGVGNLMAYVWRGVAPVRMVYIDGNASNCRLANVRLEHQLLPERGWIPLAPRKRRP